MAVHLSPYWLPVPNMSVSADKLYEAYARLDRQLKDRDYDAAVKTSKASTCHDQCCFYVLYVASIVLNVLCQHF